MGLGWGRVWGVWDYGLTIMMTHAFMKYGALGDHLNPWMVSETINKRLNADKMLVQLAHQIYNVIPSSWLFSAFDLRLVTAATLNPLIVTELGEAGAALWINTHLSSDPEIAPDIEDRGYTIIDFTRLFINRNKKMDKQDYFFRRYITSSKHTFMAITTPCHYCVMMNCKSRSTINNF